jgi:hypothetical protein
MKKMKKLPKTELNLRIEAMQKYTDVISDGGLDPRNSALDVQVGGGHYKDYAIQPVEFIHKNKIPYIEGCCIKYLCRWREKGGIEDLRKVKHYIDLLIEMEASYGETAKPPGHGR